MGESEDDALAGGARVWDSLNRIGEPPRDYVVEKLGPGTPLTWSRYKPKRETDLKSNMRILQDAGHTIQVKAATAEPMGSLGDIPFRRHEFLASSPRTARPSTPSLLFEQGSGWGPYTSAIAAAEGSQERGAACR